VILDEKILRCHDKMKFHVILDDRRRHSDAEDKAQMNCKNQFSINEDRYLLALIGKHGLESWVAVAREMPCPTPKQCRERWHNHLNPHINCGPWTAAEDRVLALRHRELGNRWPDIAKYLPGRTDTLVKNRWNTSVKCRLEEIEQCLEAPERIARPRMILFLVPGRRRR
jgi:hypothetical protein